MGAQLVSTSRLFAAAGVVHGFSLRGGGTSKAPFASLNLSRAVGDEAAAVEANLELLAASAGLAGGQAFHTATQVHGDRVLAVREAGLVEIFPESEPVGAALGAADPGEAKADALVALDAGTCAAIRVADCVPVLLHDPDSGAVAAVHSGWRGAKRSIAGRSVRALAHVAGANPGAVIAAIGPCIGRCCYAVSAELASTFRDLFGPLVADDPAKVAEPHLDLRACVEHALLAAGVPSGNLEQVEGCTSCDRDRFFSHRRDAGRTGRHLAFAVAGRGV